LRKFLFKQKIETVLNYPTALPFLPAYKRLGHKPEDFPEAFQNQNEIVSLPMFPEITSEQQEAVATAVADFYESGHV
jgi:dTDP-4-amino-4,6-dideoxygalactose transaminase